MWYRLGLLLHSRLLSLLWLLSPFRLSGSLVDIDAGTLLAAVRSSNVRRHTLLSTATEIGSAKVVVTDAAILVVVIAERRSPLVPRLDLRRGKVKGHGLTLIELRRLVFWRGHVYHLWQVCNLHTIRLEHGRRNLCNGKVLGRSRGGMPRYRRSG